MLGQLDFEDYKIHTAIILYSIFEPSTPVCTHHSYPLTFSVGTSESFSKHKD